MAAYQKAALEALYAEMPPIFNLDAKRPPLPPITQWQRRKMRLKWRWLWLRSFRIVNMASADWHKREDCDGW